MVPWAQHFLWQRLPTCKALSWSCWSLCNTDKLSPMNSVRLLKDMILPQTLLRRSKKNISTSIKITKGLQWRLYPRYRVTFFFSFFCNNINKSWDKTAYLKHLTGDFYCAVRAWHADDNIPSAQWSNLHGTGSTGIVLDVHSAIAWVRPCIRALRIPLCFLTNELKRISTGEYLSWKNYPPLLRDKQIRLNKLERVLQTRTVITESCLR